MLNNARALRNVSVRLPVKDLHGDLVMAVMNRIEMINLQIRNLDFDVARFNERQAVPYSGNPEIKIVAPIPSLRLQLAVETIPHNIYSMFDIASKMMHKLSPNYKASFHKIADGIEAHDPKYAQLAERIGCLTAYYQARELRTEWTHYSASFIGLDKAKQPLVVLYSRRGISDKVHFKEPIPLKVSDIRQIAEEALSIIDGVAAHVLYDLVLPKLDRSQKFLHARRDANGHVVIRDNRMVPEEVTVEEVLRELGLAG
jgi:hypothetical protein